MHYFKCGLNERAVDSLLMLPDSLLTQEEVVRNNLNFANFSPVDVSDADIIDINGTRFLKSDFEKKSIIEVDADGVILDIHRHLDNYVKDLYPDFNGDKDISSWGMHELDLLHKDLRSRCLELFNCIDFMTSIPYLDGAVDAMRKLDSLQRERRDVIVIVNSHCYSDNLSDVRQVWLNKKLKTTGINVIVKTCSGSEKEMLNSQYCIEDNVDNLKKSNASYKFLVARGHNRYANYNDLGTFKNCFLGMQLSSYVDIIINIVRGTAK